MKVTPERWRQIEVLYRAAIEKEPAARATFLAQADPELRPQVEALLAQRSGEKGLLDRPAWEGAEELLDSTVAEFAAGAQIGPYKIEGLLGTGGMGEVFRAIDTRLGRPVAIKTTREQFAERFIREGRAISSLNHPHICTLYDVGPNYLVMELCEGETLAARLKRGKLSIEDTIRYGAQIADALADAHAKGIVHRDLKPSNMMLTRHGVKVLDFGLAKMLSETGVTQTRAVMGTPAYMAPEQAEGREPSGATDLFSFGLVLYEMAVGKRPFPGASLGQMLSTGSIATPALAEQLVGLPTGLDGLVLKLLAKDPALRPQSASAVARELSAIAERLTAPPSQPRVRPAFAVGALVSLLLLAGAGLWLYHRIEQRRWVREEAIPEFAKLAPKQPLAAFLLLRKAEEILPHDPQLTEIAKSSTRLTSVESTPSGANVEIQDYLTPGDWFLLGATPFKNVRIPNGYFRWKISNPGDKEFVVGQPVAAEMRFTLPSPQEAQAGMVPVPGGAWGNVIDFIGWLRYDLPAFDIDRFEVTNAQYQEFVDHGGYRKPEYWKENFVRDGKVLTWEEAIEQFRDPTGRSGPSTWQAGHFPQGQADYPVSGVSWFEASAYAAFAGKSLPVIGQWFKAAPPDFTPFSINQSNFGGRGPVRVGLFAGVGPFGTYDMAGNVREWCSTPMDDMRSILGGAWGTQTYQSYEVEAIPPFDRSPLNGFRCVRNSAPLSAAAAGPVVLQTRDFAKAKPVSDEVFQAYRLMYAYDHLPLNTTSDGVVDSTEDWTKQRITIDAANERLPIYLFLPKNIHPPYQTVLFFPSARVNTMPSSRNLGDLEFVDYVIRSGRALAYPVYKGTYERPSDYKVVGGIGDLDRIIQQSKEVRRTVDYLETRPDIDKAKIAYLGVSQGTAYGVIFATLEDRFKTVVFLDGGFFLNPSLPARDQMNFAPRMKKPMLMINGRYDITFSPVRSQEPMFRVIGTAESDKRRVVFDTPHDISQQKEALSKEVLAWLDKYLGRIN